MFALLTSASWNLDKKSRTLSYLALDFDLTLMGLNYFFGQVETDTQPFLFSREERFKNMLLIFFSYPPSRIFDLYNRRFFLLLCFD